MKYNYPFTEEEMLRAAEEWNCNCGPSALAFALQVPLDKVRGKIPGFEAKRYTSPTMMKAALLALSVRWREIHPDKMRDVCHPQIALTRIQWTGPWTDAGANPKWAYRQTHWVATWRVGMFPKPGELTPHPDSLLVFDCNGGIRPLASWESEIVPLLTAQYPRAYGGWFPTHVWRLETPK